MTTSELRKKSKLFRYLHHWYFVLMTNTAIDWGLKHGHNDYTKFIIISRGRSGTNFLRGMLNSHHQIVSFGEIFRKFGNIGWTLTGYHTNKHQNALIQTNPIRFIEKYIFRKTPIRTKAIGFKIFYYHAQNSEWKCVWKHLQTMKNLHVIHLTRKNRLATYLSTYTALKTDVWSVKSNNKVTTHEPVRVEYEDCLEFFEKTEALENHANLFFKNSKTIEVAYEELSANPDEEMTRILNFLGIDQEDVKPDSYKQNVKPLADGIENYAELKAKFAGTPWYKYFE